MECTKRRLSCPLTVQFIWDAIDNVRQQKKQVSLERILLALKKAHELDEKDSEKQILMAVKDNLLYTTQKIGCKGNQVGVEQTIFHQPNFAVHKDGHDWYCFQCHRGGSMLCCSECFRVFHDVCCRKDLLLPTAKFICPVCTQCVDPHRKPPKKEDDWRESHLIYNYVDIMTLESKVLDRKYRNIEEFEADVQNIVHNVVIYYGVHSPVADMARQMLRDCTYDLTEIRQCTDCYRMSNEKKSRNWFCQPCNPPHELVFAKQKGYPFWPAKVIRKLNADKTYDVRFFGGPHERANVEKSCIKPINSSPSSLGIKRSVSWTRAHDELKRHQRKVAQQLKGSPKTSSGFITDYSDSDSFSDDDDDEPSSKLPRVTSESSDSHKLSKANTHVRRSRETIRRSGRPKKVVDYNWKTAKNNSSEATPGKDKVEKRRHPSKDQSSESDFEEELKMTRKSQILGKNAIPDVVPSLKANSLKNASHNTSSSKLRDSAADKDTKLAKKSNPQMLEKPGTSGKTKGAANSQNNKPSEAKPNKNLKSEQNPLPELNGGNLELSKRKSGRLSMAADLALAEKQRNSTNVDSKVKAKIENPKSTSSNNTNPGVVSSKSESAKVKQDKTISKKDSILLPVKESSDKEKVNTVPSGKFGNSAIKENGLDKIKHKIKLHKTAGVVSRVASSDLKSNEVTRLPLKRSAKVSNSKVADANLNYKNKEEKRVYKIVKPAEVLPAVKECKSKNILSTKLKAKAEKKSVTDLAVTKRLSQTNEIDEPAPKRRVMTPRAASINKKPETSTVPTKSHRPQRNSNAPEKNGDSVAESPSQVTESDEQMPKQRSSANLRSNIDGPNSNVKAHGSSTFVEKDSSSVSYQQSPISISLKLTRERRTPTPDDVVSSSSQVESVNVQVSVGTQTFNLQKRNAKSVQTDPETPPAPLVDVNAITEAVKAKEAILVAKFNIEKEKALESLSLELTKGFTEEKNAFAEVASFRQKQMEKVGEEAVEKLKESHKLEIKTFMEKQQQLISETKKKQWCYNCEAEAIYHCCWNTSYCSLKCQQSHWLKEHKKCCRRKR